MRAAAAMAWHVVAGEWRPVILVLDRTSICTPAVGVVSYRAPPLARDQLRRPACVTTTGWDAFIVAVLGKDNTERELGWLMR